MWEMVVSVIVRNTDHMTICLVLNGYEDRAVCICRVTALVIGLWGWMKREVYKRDELLAVILNCCCPHKGM